MTARRVLVVAAMLSVALAVQTAFLGRFALLGAKPELLLLLVVAVSMADGPVAGALTGFGAGLLIDALTGLPDGLTSIVFTAVGAAVGLARPMLQRPSAWLPSAIVGVATASALAAYALLGLLLEVETGSVARTIARIALAALYGAVVTPLVYPLATKLLERQHPVLGSVVVRR